jgi:hypothetical protein
MPPEARADDPTAPCTVIASSASKSAAAPAIREALNLLVRSALLSGATARATRRGQVNARTTLTCTGVVLVRTADCSSRATKLAGLTAAPTSAASPTSTTSPTPDPDGITIGSEPAFGIAVNDVPELVPVP